MIAVPAFAQQEPAGGSEQLVEIVVTAQRREQNLQDTPVAVSAFSAQELRNSGVSSVQELGQVDSSLNIPAAAGIYLPFLRGIGNDAAGSVGNESSVPVYIDDVYYTRLSTAYLALGDVDRVEVLKGPQGTLFGRNSSGGAIQIFTKDPGRESAGDLTIGYANYNTTSGQFYYSTPITDTLAWNIAFGGSDQRDGWGKSITSGLPAYLENEATVRSKLIWEPSSDTRVKIVGFYAHTKGDVGLTEDRVRGTYGGTAAVIAPGYPNPPAALPSLADNHGFYDNRLNFRDYNLERGYGGSIRIDQNIGLADLVSISAFRNSKGDGHYDSDYSSQNFFNGDLYDIDNQITQEFQIKSKKDDKIDWIGGAFYLHSKAGYEPVSLYGDLVNIPVAQGAALNENGIQTINSYSVYGQATMPLVDKTNLTVGLRYTKDEVSAQGQTYLAIPGAGTVSGGPNYGDSQDFEKLTWKGALDHHFTDDLMVYVSNSRGYKAGTFDTFPVNAPPAKPEVVDAYEAGLKSEFLDHRVRVNGALFWNEIKDPQVITFLTEGLAAGVGLTNAQKARIKGGEIGIEAVAAVGLKLRAAATYLDAKYVTFTDAPFYTENGTTLVGPVPGNASGHRLPNVPELRVDVGANYTLDTRVGQWIGDLSAGYTGGFAWTADNALSQKAVTLVNATLNFTPSAYDRIRFTLWGKNLVNEKYYSVAQEAAYPGGTGGDIESAAPPLTFGGSVSLKF